MTICKGLDWRLNPPTASSYVELVDPLLEEVLGNGGLAPLRKEIQALTYDLLDRGRAQRPGVGEEEAPRRLRGPDRRRVSPPAPVRGSGSGKRGRGGRTGQA